MHPATVRHLPASGYARQPWRNGHGETHEIATGPAQGEDWQWRLSLARITQDAPFSRFPGIDRLQVLVQGEGLDLRFSDADVRRLTAPAGHARYAGEHEVTGCPADGPVTVLNLMWRRGALEADYWRRPLVGTMLFALALEETWLVYVLAGQARFRSPGPVLAQGDTALLQGTGGSVLLAGGGELLVLRMRPPACDVTAAG